MSKNLEEKTNWFHNHDQLMYCSVPSNNTANSTLFRFAICLWIEEFKIMKSIRKTGRVFCRLCHSDISEIIIFLFRQWTNAQQRSLVEEKCSKRKTNGKNENFRIHKILINIYKPSQRIMNVKRKGKTEERNEMT